MRKGVGEDKEFWEADGPRSTAVNKVFQAMLDCGFTPNNLVYTVLIDGHFKTGNLIEAFATFRCILGLAVHPDLQTYNIFTNRLSLSSRDLCKAGEIEGVQLYDEMCSKGIDPNIYMFNSLIDGLCKLGDMRRARKLFGGIQEKGFAPNNVTYSTMVDGYCKAGDLAEGFNLFNVKQSEEAGCNNYEILIEVHCKKDNLIEAFQLQEEILGKGLLSKGTAYDTLIDGVCKKGDLSKAVGVLDETRQQGVKPCSGTCSSSSQ
ncbi:hypothetical protein Pint_36612 [Pistacia integerrima]|uniref:Uncharacterized protein n=1 Tax=Pistacia integerrima TaxID=434235 RepID=A0ACC0XYY2_9ROSI|nr:hypothetical protein Pint_36612 [Pistacia integerrima]